MRADYYANPLRLGTLTVAVWSGPPLGESRLLVGPEIDDNRSNVHAADTREPLSGAAAVVLVPEPSIALLLAGIVMIALRRHP